MKKIFSIATAAALLLSSCAQDIDIDSTSCADQSPVFTCTTESGTTRTSLAKDGDRYAVNWVAGDQIIVSNGAQTAIYKAKTGGSTTVQFAKATWGAFTGDSFTAYYPVDLIDGVLPSVQTYAADNVADVPMIATSTTTSFGFKNIAAMVRLSISTSVSDVKVKEIRLMADQGLSGNFTLADGIAVVEGTEGVTLSCPEAVTIGSEPVPFHISVPANVYTGLSIRIITSDGRQACVRLADGATYKVSRSQLREIAVNVTSFTDHLSGKAVLMAGPEYAATVKRLVNSSARTYTVDSTFTKVVFKTCCFDEGTVRVDAPSSEEPIYATLEKTTNNLVISTPATEIYTGENASYLFAYMKGITDIENIAALNTSQTKYFNNMFCFNGTTSKLKSLDLSHFDTRCGITFKGMFMGLPFESLDVSNIDTSNASILSYMFAYMTNLKTIDVSHFNTSKVFSFGYMFNHCEKLQSLDLRNFDTSNAVDFDNMFSYCLVANPIDISSFRTPKAYYMRSMFNRCKAVETLDFSGFTNEELMYMQYIFQYCVKLKGANFDKFKTPKVRNMSYVFRYCYALEELDLREWDLSHATTLSYSFQYCTALKKLDLSGENCKTTLLANATCFVNASNAVREMRFGKDFLCENLSMEDNFYQAAAPTYLKATAEDPLVIYCTAAFAQKSLSSSSYIRTSTNLGVVKWISIYDQKTELVMSEAAGSLTSSVQVTDPAQSTVINVTI